MTAPDRKIGRHHIAFYRGWLHGLDLRVLSDRYLETGLDLRLAKNTLVWIRDTVRQAALRNGKLGEARLLRTSLALPANVGSLTYPSLEDYQAEKDPTGFYGEDDLIRLYLETYPQAADKQAQHRRRLVGRQIAALIWIERLLVTEPAGEDLISAWFDRAISDRLVLAGMVTIGAVMERIRAKGYRWWITVPRLGEKGAARIIHWLHGYESSLGVIPQQALMPMRSISVSTLIGQRPRQTAIVPMETLRVPGDLDGARGSNRFPGSPRIEATNDHQAILAWLATKSGSQNTQRAYRREAERVVLWAVIERGKGLSDLNVEDCAAYRDWLASLGRVQPDQWLFRLPQENWIAPRNTPRFSSDWRPFDGALSASSVKHALTILGGLFEWLVSVQYCAFNPWGAIGKSLARTDDVPGDVELTRVFSEGQWQFLMDFTRRLPDNALSRRLCFVLPLAQSTGLRLSELVDAQTGRIYTMILREGIGVRWMLKVRGKGNKWRAVPLTDGIVELLRDYLAYRGLASDPLAAPPETPFIPHAAANKPVSPSGLYKALRALFNEAAGALLQAGKNQEAKGFERATAHWLRHTCGSHLGSTGVPVNLIQKLLGHASVATTSIYTETDDESLWKEMAALEASDAG